MHKAVKEGIIRKGIMDDYDALFKDYINDGRVKYYE